MNLNTAKNFEFSHHRYYPGPNFYLHTSALVFEVEIGNKENLLSLEPYLIALEKQLPRLGSEPTDNRQLAEEIAQYFRLVCLGIDVITTDLSQSWKDGNLGIIEINAAPGVFMHLNPAMGKSIDVPGKIMDFLFPPAQSYRLPIITTNCLSLESLEDWINYLLSLYPHLLIGGVCRGGVRLNHSGKPYDCNCQNYNDLVQSFLRHLQLELLIVEYSEDIFSQEGMAYFGSNLVILDEPTEIEKMLTRDTVSHQQVILKQGGKIYREIQDKMELYQSKSSESFADIYRYQSYLMISECLSCLL